MKISDFDYDLPDDLIAQAPAERRTGSRLLHLDGATGALRDLSFAVFPELLRPGDLVVLNDTRVLKARLWGRKESGGRVEVLVERLLTAHEVLAQVRASHSPAPGSLLDLGDGVRVRVDGRQGQFFVLRFEGADDVLGVLERHGSVPLPPYIVHDADGADEERYQTVYARDPGAVAAPTAGLHFDREMLGRVEAAGCGIAYVTLHVGAGTFQPVRAEDVRTHAMHSEWYRVPQDTVDAVAAARARGGRVLAVGTTTLRALESAAAGGELAAGSGETNLFVLPGFRFRVVERLLTNFHLPRSTLLMLVSAFGGMEPVRRAYRHAVESRYRFFSYGDAMLIERAPA